MATCTCVKLRAKTFVKEPGITLSKCMHMPDWREDYLIVLKIQGSEKRYELGVYNKNRQ
jgi:hypothetical protein